MFYENNGTEYLLNLIDTPVRPCHLIDLKNIE